MKQPIKQLLDDLTDIAVMLNFTRIRRSFVAKKVENELFACISIQHREWADGHVTVNLYSQAIWKPVEDLVAIGHGWKYKFGESFTATTFQSPLKMLDFSTLESVEEEKLRYKGFLQKIVIPKSMELSNKDSLLSNCIENLTTKKRPIRPDIALAILVVLEGNDASIEHYDRLFELLDNETDKLNFSRFWSTLRGHILQ